MLPEYARKIVGHRAFFMETFVQFTFKHTLKDTNFKFGSQDHKNKSEDPNVFGSAVTGILRRVHTLNLNMVLLF